MAANAFSALASFTRPSNATLYTVNDVVSTTAGAVMEFTNVVRAPGGTGIIHTITLTKSDDDATGAAFDLYLFNAAPAAVADNAAFALSAAERLTVLALVPFVAANARASGTGNEWSVTDLHLPFVCASASRSLYGMLVARGAYTPASAEVFGARLLGLQD